MQIVIITILPTQKIDIEACLEKKISSTKAYIGVKDSEGVRQWNPTMNEQN